MSIRMFSPFAGVVIMICAAIAIPPSFAPGQDKPNPFSYKELLDLIGNRPEELVRERVKARGVDFELTAEQSKELRNKNASDELLKLIRSKAPKANLEIQCSVPCEVRLDGIAIGPAGPGKPCSLENMQPGKVIRVEVTAPGYRSESKDIALRAGANPASFILRRLSGTLIVDCKPEDCEIVLDKQPSLKAQSGRLVLRDLDPGPHTIEASSKGFRPKVWAGDVRAEVESKIELILEPLQGALELLCDPADCNILLDGKPGKKDPQGRITGLSPGEHTVTASREGYGPLTKKVFVSPDQLLQVSFKLVKDIDSILKALRKDFPGRGNSSYTLVGIFTFDSRRGDITKTVKGGKVTWKLAWETDELRSAVQKLTDLDLVVIVNRIINEPGWSLEWERLQDPKKEENLPLRLKLIAEKAGESFEITFENPSEWQPLELVAREQSGAKTRLTYTQAGITFLPEVKLLETGWIQLYDPTGSQIILDITCARQDTSSRRRIN